MFFYFILKRGDTMITFSYDYVKPKSLEEALDILDQENVYPILGGTDLIVKMRAGVIKPNLIVDLKNIDELPGFDTAFMT
jgi:CO/xanthine dehydrogenase FAD-binding subunit